MKHVIKDVPTQTYLVLDETKQVKHTTFEKSEATRLLIKDAHDFIETQSGDLTTEPEIFNPVVKGSVVRYKGGWMVVTAAFKNHVNLGPRWGGRGKFSGIIVKIPRSEVFEDGDAQYDSWTRSESYQCM